MKDKIAQQKRKLSKMKKEDEKKDDAAVAGAAARKVITTKLETLKKQYKEQLAEAKRQLGEACSAKADDDDDIAVHTT